MVAVENRVAVAAAEVSEAFTWPVFVFAVALYLTISMLASVADSGLLVVVSTAEIRSCVQPLSLTGIVPVLVMVMVAFASAPGYRFEMET